MMWIRARRHTLRSRGVGRLVLAAFCWLTLTAQSYSPSDLDDTFGKDVLIISASEHACHRIDLWVARDRGQQQRGLMFVRNLPRHSGMLFVYSEPGTLSMWMKNTYIPLDIVFIRANGQISSIIENAEPLSLRSLSSIEPVTYVLELGGGVSTLLKLSAGNTVFWSGI